jgi:hypothetical protein
MIDGLIVLALGENNAGQFYEMLINLWNGYANIGKFMLWILTNGSTICNGLWYIKGVKNWYMDWYMQLKS